MRKFQPLVLFISMALASIMVACGHSSAPLTVEGEKSKSSSESWEKLENSPGSPGKDYDPRRIIVTYKAGGSLPTDWPTPLHPHSQAAKMSNAILRADKSYETLTDALAERYALTIKTQVYLGKVRLASFLVPEGTDPNIILSDIRADGATFVEHATYAPLRNQAYQPSDPKFKMGPNGDQWGHWRVNCEPAWDVTLGSDSVMIAVVDTGVRLTHEELNARVINPQVQFPGSNCDVINDEKSIEDVDGHGTFIAGIICAEADNNRTIVGAAPGCRVLPIKISNFGSTPIDVLIAGASLAKQLGAKVINYSWGSYYGYPPEEDMIDNITSGGTLFVCAAGNDGIFGDMYPPAYSNAFSVGATGRNDRATVFSNWGAAVDIAAPGEELLSCSPWGDDEYSIDGAGTSYAAPLVAAAAGLLWSNDPGMTLLEVRSALAGSGTQAEGFLPGVNRLDIYDALQGTIPPVFPSASSVSIAPHTFIGAVGIGSDVPVQLQGASNVAKATYTLDLAPFGNSGPEDIVETATSGAGSYSVNLHLPAGLRNQLAELNVRLTSISQNTSSLSVSPLWVFMQRGDVNSDGMVTQLDVTSLAALVGLSQGMPGYIGFADGDMDGAIRETDASVVGYSFGDGVVPAQVLAVQGGNGSTQQQASFLASVVGSGTVSYVWDFGGGATPNTSLLPSPTVLLGAPGTYNGTLSVDNGFGNDSYDFSYTVAPPDPPLALIGASPKVGEGPLTVYFDATASYSVAGITKYEWSWEDNGVFDDTAGPVTSHEYAVLGDHTARLRVTDGNNSTAEATVGITVQPTFDIGPWQEYSLGQFGNGGGDIERLEVATIGGKPAVMWVWADSGSPEQQVYLAVAKVETPLSLADWRVEIVHQGRVTDPISLCDINGEAAFAINSQFDHTIYYGRYYGDIYSKHAVAYAPVGQVKGGVVANVAGHPAIVYRSETEEMTGTVYCAANTPDPSDESDWTRFLITTGLVDNPNNYGFRFLSVGGRPMWLSTAGTYPAIRRAVCYGMVDDPDSPDDFAVCSMNNDVTSALDFAYLDSMAGLPVLIARLNAPFQLARATVLSPADDTDWTYSSLPGSNLLLRAATIMDGKVALLRGPSSPTPVKFYLSIDTNPVDEGDYVSSTLPPTMQSFNFKLLRHAFERPAVIALSGGNVVYRYPEN